MTDIKRAIEILKNENHTCVLVKEKSVVISNKSGIAPMLGFIKENRDLCGYSVADKIVGKAAAMLFIKAKVIEVFAEVTTYTAEKLLKKNGILVAYATITKEIINRSGTGPCPMEEAVKNCLTPDEALLAIEEKIQNMKEATV